MTAGRVRALRALSAAVVGLCVAGSAAAQQLAQAGSAGGSIGGSIATPSPPPSRAERPAPVRRERPVVRREGGGFDGAWVVHSIAACNVNTSGQVTISKGRIIANGSVVGGVSPSGAVHTSFSGNGITVTSSGRLAGAGGSGVFRRSDGCAGTWTASRV